MDLVTIVDYGVGNLASISNMIRRVGGEARIVSTSAEIGQAEKLLLPGVGAWDAAMAAIMARGLERPLRAYAASGRPLLGICLGMQLLFERSQEGELPGLALIPGRISRFDDSCLRVPHMGWNVASPAKPSRLFGSAEDEQRFYFAHSYFAEPRDWGDVAATAHYGADFPCAFERDNILGAQFHPEKSHRFGMALFARYLAL